MILGWVKWQSMPAWRARWQDRDARLQLRRLAAEIDQIRSLAPNLDRLVLINEAEALIAIADDGSTVEGLGERILALRDRIEAESIRSVLDDME